VADLLLSAYDAVGAFSEDYRAFLATPEAWVPGATHTFVAADHVDRPIGVVSFVLPGDTEFEGFDPPPCDAGFRFLAVDLAVQGRGAGRALVQRCLDAARWHEATRLGIHSMYFMTAAHALYTDMGFERRPDLDVMFPSGHGFAFTVDLHPDAARRFPAPGPAPDPIPWYADAWAAPVDDRPEPC
jgi:GNAT superfamily N-acetyltransferase